MKLISKFQKGEKFSNTPTGRAMQRQYDLEHGITMQKVLPEVEVFPNQYDIDNNGYSNSFAIPLKQRPTTFSQGEISQPYVPKKLDEQGWLNRTFGINNFGLGIRELIGNPANVIPTGKTMQVIKALSNNISTKAAQSGGANYFKASDPRAVDFFKKYLAQRRISGLSVDQFDNTILPGYQRGLDLNTKRNLMHNTVERNIRELRKAGLSEELLEAEKQAAREALDNVSIGHFTPEEYEVAGQESAGGFITDNGFISIQDNPSFSVQFRKSIPRHEGRHLLQRHLTKPASYYKELPEAYGDDFERLNQWEGSPESIKNVRDMKVERETTNRDARDYLFSFDGRDKSLQEAELKFQDMVTDYTPDDKIFEAVENANGYGRTYINYLRENNLLTPEKAQAFREAMKHVGAYLPWISGSSIGYNYLNQDNTSSKYTNGGKLIKLIQK